MQELFYIFKIQRQPGSHEPLPYSLYPLITAYPKDAGSVSNYPNEHLLDPFKTEEQAKNYIEQQNGRYGTLVVIKTYGDLM
ncbi:hypothetical protein [Spirosoma endbachense]|uniref:Uncharacterized protein n=1 Tax=Spirosoma endbachense TaxID=2666025 RepID=A0A6P1W5V8_9BACT|nr:hypothetical protein [Spirosoma endbachense]QHV99320.1 hypothetical protein GJR95_31815 [Spirosoma endbachense]